MLYIVMAAMGALIGWGTNMVAIWLLFHPYRPIRLGPRNCRGYCHAGKLTLPVMWGKQ